MNNEGLLRRYKISKLDFTDNNLTKEEIEICYLLDNIYLNLVNKNGTQLADYYFNQNDKLIFKIFLESGTCFINSFNVNYTVVQKVTKGAFLKLSKDWISDIYEIDVKKCYY